MNLNEKKELVELLERKLYLLAQNDFKTFVKVMAPFVLPDTMLWGRHIEVICDALEEVERGETKRLMIFMPPGSMKSRLGSILFPTWVMGRHPNWQVLQVSHSVELAKEFGRYVRNLVTEEEFRKIFPELILSEDSQAAGKWNTSKNGSYFAAGAGKRIAGFRGKIAILDDVISEQEAYSKLERENIIRWYPGGLRSRLLNDGRVVIINTRWHQSDLSGWLLEEAKKSPLVDQWKVISIPALLDEKSAKLLGGKAGESYWPEMWSTDHFLREREQSPPSQWNALFMQNPIPEEGSVFKERFFKKYAIEDEDDGPECIYILQTIDTAMTTKTHSDYSVIQTWGIFESTKVDTSGNEKIVSNLILLGNERARMEYPDLRRKAQELYEEFKPDVVLIEDKAHGIALIQDLQIAGVPVRPFSPDRDKVARAYAATPLMEVGRVWVPDPTKKSWARSLVDEALMFSPSGSHQHDDQVDSMVMAILFLKMGWYLSHPEDNDWTQETKDQRRRPRTYWSASSS